MNRLIAFPLAALLCLSLSCSHQPIPKEKRAFIGRWKSNSGFSILIRADGSANLYQHMSQNDPDYEKLCIQVGPGTIEDMQVTFEGENLLKVAKSVQYAKVYRIDQQPHTGVGYNTIVLNGVILVKQ